MSSVSRHYFTKNYRHNLLIYQKPVIPIQVCRSHPEKCSHETFRSPRWCLPAVIGHKPTFSF